MIKRKIMNIFSILIIVSMLVTTCSATNLTPYQGQTVYTPTEAIGSFPSPEIETRSIDGLQVIKGTPLFHETGAGAHYYAFSTYSSAYQEAMTNISLPTAFNNANNTRVGYISLGIYGSQHGIDLGIRNLGDGWRPYYYDVNNVFKDYEEYTAPSTAKSAIITVNPVSTTSVRMYVKFEDANGNTVGNVFDKTIPVSSGNLVTSGGNIICRFYRFASLVPIGTDNQMDSSYMLNGQFRSCQLYRRSTSSYVSWGITSSTMACAWEVSPERINLSYSGTVDIFSIDHWAPGR